MSEFTETTTETGEPADTTAADESTAAAEAAAERDVIQRLADRGQQTVARLADLPGGTKALGAMNDLRNRVDELGKKVRGIDELEKRVAALEEEVAALKKP